MSIPTPPRSVRFAEWQHYIRRLRFWWTVDGRAASRKRARDIYRELWLASLLVLLTIIIVLPLFEPVYRGGIFTAPASLVAVLTTIAEALASLVGIVIAVILVALELFQATFSTTAVREVFRTPTFRRLLTLYLYTIGLALGVTLFVGDSVSPTVIALSYLVGALTAACLLVLYPALKRILSATRVSYARLQELAATIDGPELGHRFGLIHARDLERLEGDPAYLLSEIAIRSIARGDRVAPRMVIGVVTDRLLHILKNDAPNSQPERLRDRLQSFLPIYRSVGSAAVSQDDELTLKWLYRSAELIHQLAAELKLPWHVLVEFDEWLQAIAVASAERGLDDTTRVAAWAVSNILEAQLRHNVPDEKDVWDLSRNDGDQLREPDYDKANQWSTVSERYISILVRLIEALLEHDHIELATMGLMRLAGVMDTVHRLENLGPSQKDRIIRRSLLEAEMLVVDKSKHLPLRTLLALYPFSSLRLKKWLDDDTLYAKLAILVLCRTLLRLGEQKRLDGYALNELGTLARGSIERIDDAPRFGEAVVLACDTFQRMSELYGQPASVSDVQVIRDVEEQLKSLENWFAAKTKVSAGAQEHLHDALQSVRAVVIPEQLQRLEKLEWPSNKATAPPPTPTQHHED